jgi:rod shape determining protein RodA
MVLGMSMILLVQIVYAIFFVRNAKEAFILLLSVLVIGIGSYVLNIWFYVNYNYVAIFTVVASCIYWMFIELFNRYKKYWFLVFFSLGSVLFSFSADYLFTKVLEEHQQVRIKVLLNMDNAPLGAGYNVNQSKIAIGSGGFFGKGFLNGTQTKLKFVPEQDTDFIFCTVGEEHGFLGSTLVLFVYWLLLMRILRMAERQHDPFSRVYAYCVASIFFFHLMINIGMVLGIMPVIGIPLPFFSWRLLSLGFYHFALYLA